MQPERWQQISGIFKSAIALEPEKRAAYVAAQCGPDEALRQEVEKLIGSHQKADQADFINSPAVEEVAPLLVPEDNEGEVDKDRLEKGQQVNHYLILQKIGAGGMGEVYLATDTRLDRTMALKILPAEVASDQRRMLRFKQEAKIVSSLNQPNILTIYEFGEADSLHFIAMEFIDGDTLRYRLSTTKLSLPELLDIAIQVTAALDAAHEARIVHRDIKPENIMLRTRDAVVKVLDFGLAKLSEAPASSSGPTDTEANTAVLLRTMPGSVLGTINYMSPEQAQGLKVDARTDIWSTGVVLFEMVTGRTPFSGPTSSHTVVEIIERQPPALSQSASRQVPAELERIVGKALAKKTDERYQTAKDMLIDLKNLRRRVELDQEIERSVSPHSGTVAATVEENVVAGTDPVEAQRTNVDQNEVERPRRTKVITVVALISVLVVGVIIAANWSRLQRSSVASPTSGSPAASSAASERKLGYWITVQKYRNGRPFEDPFRLTGEINFEKDYRVRLNVSSPQPGYLYILNEGPLTESATPFVVLFPSTTANDGLSYLAQNQRVEIPHQGWFQFDAEEGTEKLWLVFSGNSIPELEAVKQFANKKDQGVISDVGLHTRVQEFIRAHSNAKVALEKDEELKQTSLTIKGDILVHPIKLEHH